ncbi:TonB-dependent receptor plug domain-containing protein [Flavobacterium daemonense]|uniref:TonB-dependent receptor plug domain-containing protein n=1 Tax=Flavobacterium daemonense TaxID=1393049 RepID=UPI001184F46D|nr:TonB-dependent receptor plug domain-containing protein [Flavobacterium daemonense]KAF2332466.1 TonB-dependent receptor plug domain-containing protein [Flavobacterium daemonense]
MKSLKLISLVLTMLSCFVMTAQEKTVSKETPKNNSAEANTLSKDSIHAAEIPPNTRVIICAPSRSSAKEPLVIVDGKVINSKEFSTINPNSIESINIVKEDKAKIIYGDKGANGVIIITLKK